MAVKNEKMKILERNDSSRSSDALIVVDVVEGDGECVMSAILETGAHAETLAGFELGIRRQPQI